MKKEKVVLAYSGGLDTSVILKWLENKGHEVICFVGNVGQNENFQAINEKVYQMVTQSIQFRDAYHSIAKKYAP